MKTLRYLLQSLFVLLPLVGWAQLQEPVTFKVESRHPDANHLELVFKGTIEDGWHVYSTDLDGGPTAATFHLEESEGVELDGKLKPGAGEQKKYDAIFSMDVRYFEQTAEFSQKLKVTAPKYKVKGYMEYGACDDANCIPPTQVEFDINGNDGPTEAAATDDAKNDTKAIGDAVKVAEKDTASTPDTTTAQAAALTTEADANTADTQKWWQPVIKELSAFDGGKTSDKSLWLIFGLGLLGGLLALLTPCVWPVIPMTVSFFLHRNEGKKRTVRDAAIYGLSIAIIYVGAGLLITLLSAKGASALNDMSTNAFFNLFFFALLLLFGASFLGGFEITLPASWTGKVNGKADSLTGFLSIFFMAFTLVLVSFSCTGPIIGFLLVEISTRGSLLAPLIGMSGFALSLALPFSLFALFPSWLAKMPKSGGWMNVIKVTLGFIEIAFALKFLSVADLAYGWHILDRETFLALWIVLFALLGWYLLGKLRFPADDEVTHTSVPRFFMALASLAFAVYLVPGLWGAPVKAVSAFAPPAYTQDFRLGTHTVEAQFKDYEAGMDYAAKVKKPVMLDFTGFGCVNCRKMEQAVWNDEVVARILGNDFVLISLYVDDKTPLPQPIEITENGQTRKLRTVGDRWSYLQRSKFGANAQPFYVAVDNDGKPLAGAYAYDEDVQAYIKFLEKALKNY